MPEKHDLLVEIGTEELPPKALLVLSLAFRKEVETRLGKVRLGYEKIEHFATPRRLALRILALDSEQSTTTSTRKGPSLAAAFGAEGQPTKAALGFARSCGVTVGDLEKEQTEKGGWLVFTSVNKGRKTESLVAEIIESALEALPIPKRMRWGDLITEFVRPVHWIVMLYGKEPINAVVMGILASDCSRGHRFHHPGPLRIGHPKDYADILRNKGWVEADFSARRESIRRQAEAAAADYGKVLIDPDLLDEVTALTEWPVVIIGSFDEKFLEVPAEVLVETMQKNQKYFPIVDRNNKLIPKFVTVSNIDSKDPEQVREGNERVVTPRFKDASFFWEKDLKLPLDHLTSRLGKVVFQKQLGTLEDKAERMGVVASEIARRIGLEPALALRAATISKCDLLTDMVGEFAGLQGIMGRYYATAAGEDDCVSEAMEEQYLPRHAGDALPKSKCGQALAIADRLDSLVGIFAIGKKPTGVKDPYGLRRASLGVLRIMIETPLDLDLVEFLRLSADTLIDKVDSTSVLDEVFHYMMDRLHGYYAEKGVPVDTVESVLVQRHTVPVDIDKRINAVASFRQLSDAQSLSAANKRIRNILRTADTDVPGKFEVRELELDSEKNLAAQVSAVTTLIQPSLAARDYETALMELSKLKPHIDEFFDTVMVLCEDREVRRNRLALLRHIGDSFNDIADISRLQ